MTLARTGIAALLVAAGALAQEQAPAHKPFLWTIPEEVQTIEVPAVADVDGLPVRFNVFASRLPPEDLAAYYLNEFAKAGLFVAPRKDQMDLGSMFQLTAFDPESQVTYTVLLRPLTDKLTRVITGQAYFKDYRKPGGGADFAPVMPNAKNVLRSNLEGWRSITFTSSADRAEIDAFYRETMPRAGYRESAPETFVKGDQQVTVQTSKLEGGELAVALTQRAAPPEAFEGPPVH